MPAICNGPGDGYVKAGEAWPAAVHAQVVEPVPTVAAKVRVAPAILAFTALAAELSTTTTAEDAVALKVIEVIYGLGELAPERVAGRAVPVWL